VPLSNEAEFPKLSPPKKSGGQHNRTNSNGSGMEFNNNNNSSNKKFVVDMKANGLDNKPHNNSSTGVIYNSGMNYKAAERHDRHERHEMSSQNSNLSNNHDEEPYHYEPRGGGGGKKHRANTNAKGNKPRLKNLGGSSSGSIDLGGGGGNGNCNNMSNNGQSNNSSNNTSGFISRGKWRIFVNGPYPGSSLTDSSLSSIRELERAVHGLWRDRSTGFLPGHPQ